ncbi:MAG TPA: M56 family metallopeptidase, partial [Terriglobales bacterium]|nr:M56 family metallopeptidase [Terriglobales bacterium]
MSWQSHALALLSASLLRPFALAGGAWLLIRIFRIRHPGSRHAVWTAVLLGILLLPAVSVLAPHWNLPLLPSQTSSLADAGAANPSPALSKPNAAPAGQLPKSAGASARPGPGNHLPAAGTVILAGYFTGLLAMLFYWALGWFFLRRLVANAKWLQSPRLRESASLASPVTVGVWRPTVILPVGWRAWDADVRKAVLAHEFTHLRRHDPLLLSMNRLVGCIFWFHPLALWLARKTTD